MKKILFWIAILVAVIFFAKEEGAKAQDIQQGIAEEIIRFHVIANSDREEDQSLKLEIKEEVVAYMQDVLKDVKTVEESRELLKAYSREILEIAENVVCENGYNYEVRVFFDERYFPVKTYGQFTFPPGFYEAFCIEIGESQGKNWWCVMYPSLCFVDAVHGVVPQESDDGLKNILTEEEYNEISQGQEKVQVKSYFMEFFSNISAMMR